MYFSFWNNGVFPSPWQYFVPIDGLNLTKFASLPQTQTHISENVPERTGQRESSVEKKGLIDLSKDDLIDAGYETTKKLWSEEEDRLLIKLIQVDKIPWKEIQQYISQRTEKMCYSRYRRLLSQTKQSWTREEDQKIKELVDQYGENWKQFTINFKNRSSKQIKERYTNYLRPQIRRDQWSLQEDLKIIECINNFGKKWKMIEKQIINRTDNQIKNRYYGRLKILYKNKIVKERRKKNEIKKGRQKSLTE